MKRALKTVPLCDYPAKNILLIKPSALGDIVHSLPVITALRRRFPDASIAWVVNRGFQSLLEGHPHLDMVIPFDRKAAATLGALNSYAALARRLRAARYDLVIDLQGLLRTGLMALSTAAPRRVGLMNAREGAAWCYTDMVRSENMDTLHAVERYWLVVQELGGGNGCKEFHLPLQPEAKQWANRVLEALPRPWLAMGVGASRPTKRWLPQHFADLASRAQQQFGGTAIFIGSRHDAALAHETAYGLPGPVCNLTGKTSLAQLAALLQQVDVMVANDTGPAHLAAALGRPVVAPYTCTKASLHGPYGNSNRAVEADIWCQGSYLKQCPRLECMERLTPDHLWPHLHEVLVQCQSSPVLV